MTQTDKEFIAWIAALAKKAAPGPWTRNPLDSPCEYNSIFAPTTSDGSRHLVTTPVIGHFGGANSDFIAAARTAIPRLIAMVEDREREQTRLRKFLSVGEYETVQSEQGWKRRALAAEQNCESYKYACKRAGICMTCVLKAPEPYGRTDCLNTGFTGGDPIAERDAVVVRGKQAARIVILTAERNTAIAEVAPEPPVSERWQLRETAPKDGTYFLAWVPLMGWEKDQGCFDDGDMRVVWFEGRGKFTSDRDLGDEPFTHWQPLPAAPKGKESE